MTAPEVVCVGEGLAVLTVDAAIDISSARLHVGGAEANVALHLAAQGVSAGWASRVGDDPFGRMILDRLKRGGVDTSRVEISPDRPTGMYVKDLRPDDSSVMHYYRAGSAASHMDAAHVNGLALDGVRWVHVSGITPALSDSAARLVDQLFRTARERGIRVSFDVNHRPRLWPDLATAADRLHALAQRADLVLVGRDEAEALWGTPAADDVFALLDRAGVVVVKDGEVGATEIDRRARPELTFVAAAPVKVVEAIGAGDAFAGGYLAGLLRGEAAADRLARGHAAAAWTLGAVDDVRPGHVPVPFPERH